MARKREILSPVMRRRWAVLGAGGLLGAACRKALWEMGEEAVVAPPRSALDVECTSCLRAFIRTERPTHVLNCVAHTDVDGAETAREECYRLNVGVVGALCELSYKAGFLLSQVSTAMVFNGPPGSRHAPDDRRDPVNFYSETKVLGENACLSYLAEGAQIQIPRVYWLYQSRTSGFPARLLDVASRGPRVSVVRDQWGQPTPAMTAAREIVRAARHGEYLGVLHFTTSGSTSRLDWARSILDLSGMSHVEINPISATAFPAGAKRPVDCSLSWDPEHRAGLTATDWYDDLAVEMGR